MRQFACIVLIAIALATAIEAYGRKQRTTRGNVSRRSLPAETAAAPTDTFFIPDSCEVSLYGYDKPLRSRRETVFVTNMTERNITGVSVTTQYVDGKGRRFHETKRRIKVAVPAGGTRKADYPSWDTQQSFYYIGSRRQRTQGTPYSVRQSVDTVFFSRPETEK